MRGIGCRSIGRRVVLGLPLALWPALARPAAAGQEASGPDGPVPAVRSGWRGVNLVRTPQAPLGGEACGRSLARLKALGADSLALVYFFWQERPDSAAVGLGSDYTLEELRAGIRQARALGFRVLLKPHVWVPGTWAGAIAPAGEADWQSWFAGYGAGLETLAALAAEEGAEAFALGTELRGTSARPEWTDLIRRVRARFSGTLTYVAHWDGEVERVPFWPLLDVAAVSLYPPLGQTADDLPVEVGRWADRLVDWRRAVGRPLWVGELGLRSAMGAQVRPWESAEEREAAPDPTGQAAVLAAWLAALGQRGFGDVLVWRWFSDPALGGAADTDFTVQGKPAEAVLRCAFAGGCDPHGAVR